MFKLVDLYVAGIPLADATLMLQREVADRLTAVPGTRDYGILTVLIGHHATAERVLALPPGAFRPVPKVRSALVRLRFHPPDPPARDESVFAAMVQAIFTRRRKTLANALLAFAGAATLPPARALAAAGIDGRRRPETLSIAELIRVADVFAAKSG
jgi:16S rRNA (adenine1518-N6/adenine1519-N6)-dimethyltransferase